MDKQTQLISIPIHPDDADVPTSLVHIALSNGRYATICGPLGKKSLQGLIGTLKACEDIIITAPRNCDDFSI